MAEKRTEGKSDHIHGGLNADNPNTESTPLQTERPVGLTGGQKQSNQTDLQEGNVPDRTGEGEADKVSGRS